MSALSLVGLLTRSQGTAGWKHLAEPMLDRIKPPSGPPGGVGAESDGIVDLSRDRILVHHGDLAAALHRLRSLIVSHPNPGLCKRLLSPLLLPLWALSSWHNIQQSVTKSVCTPALELFKIHLKLVSSPDVFLFLVRNLGYGGGCDKRNPEWIYKTTDQGEIEIVDSRQHMKNIIDSASQVTLRDINLKIPKLLDLATSTLSDADISTAFLELLKKWIKSPRNLKGRDIMVKRQEEEEEDPLAQLAEIKALQAMMEKFPDKLATQPKHILDIVSQILASSGDNPDDEEVIEVALSLLNMIITAPGFQKARVAADTLSLVESSLDRLSKQANSTDLTKTANNLRLLLLYRDQVDDTPTATSSPTSRQIEDRRTYNLAISYISQPDSPPPVRSEGLNLIATLITSQSPILDIPGILVLLSSLISDSDEYIYLRIIKLYTLLADKHPRAVTTELVDHFLDARETHPVDSRLRFGEALLQVIQRMGETFTGAMAEHVGNALLSVAGRRGRRPKTEARQEREKRAQERMNREVDEVWGGKVPDFSDPLSEEERVRNEVLERIVEGWESKRSSEDVRVRASALSVLGAAVESHVAGLGQGVVAAGVDLCVAVLQLEREIEKGILRRAAVLFVMSFVRALEGARRSGRTLGFGFGKEAQEDVMRTLRYVAETDDDGLVVQHARDVVESLENWQVVRLLPDDGESGGQGVLGVDGGLTKLAGLEVDPERSATLRSGQGPRPKIEEIE